MGEKYPNGVLVLLNMHAASIAMVPKVLYLSLSGHLYSTTPLPPLSPLLTRKKTRKNLWYPRIVDGSQLDEKRMEEFRRLLDPDNEDRCRELVRMRQ